MLKETSETATSPRSHETAAGDPVGTHTAEAEPSGDVPDLRHDGPEVIHVEDRERWHDIRRGTVGASESAALLVSVPEDGDEGEGDGDAFVDADGEPVSPHASPYELWALKTGRLRPQDREKQTANQRTMWGRNLEPVIAEGMARQHGWEIRLPEGYYLHPSDHRIGASLDYEVDLDGLGLFEPLEIKNVAGTEQWRWKNSLGDWVVPEHIQVQVQHQMLVTGHERAVVGVLFGGSDDRHFVIERDDALIAEIRDAIAAFWESVEADDPPEPDWRRDVDVVKKINVDIDNDRVADWRDREDLARIADEQRHHAQQKTYHEEQARKLSAKLQRELGGAAAGVIAPDRIVKASRVEGKQISYYRDPYVQLRIGPPPKRHAGPELERVLDRGKT